MTVKNVSLFLAGLCLGAMLVWLNPKDQTESPIKEIQAKLGAQCIGHPEMLQEIQDKLPDNTNGLITPEILRQVIADVVNKC